MLLINYLLGSSDVPSVLADQRICKNLKTEEGHQCYKYDLLTDRVIEKVYFDVFKQAKKILQYEDLFYTCWVAV